MPHREWLGEEALDSQLYQEPCLADQRYESRAHSTLGRDDRET